MAGLFGAPNRPAVVRALEAGLRAPDRPVTGSYLRTLSTLSVYLQHPEFRPAQTRDTKGRLVTGGTGSMIHEDDTRIVVWSIDEPGESHIELAQYHFKSIAALKEKIARYPRGTSLTLQRHATENGDVTATIAEIMAFAASQGLSIKAR